jgi:hypothetical protein
MKQIIEITNEAHQKHTLLLEDKTRVEMTLDFLPTQRQWFMSVSYGDFELKNKAVVNGPNILRRFKNIIPFGIAILSDAPIAPSFIDSFSDGTSRLYLLEKADVEYIEAELYKGVL